MFSFFKKPAKPFFDRTGKEPVIRCSICTGEKVAGYKSEETGRFTEVMLIRDDRDLEEFLKKYGFTREELKYEW